MTGPRSIEPAPAEMAERAHLLDATGFTPPIHRYAPSPEVADVVRRHWLPVWSLPAGHVSVQRVLQYPVCQLVLADDCAQLVGPTTGLSTQEIAGTGWVLGVMLQPAPGQVLAGGPVSGLTDRVVPLAEAAGVDGAALERRVLETIAGRPDDPDRRLAAVTAVDEALRPLLPVDDEGLLVNAIVEYVEGDPAVQRVGQICEKFAITERTLQRLTARRIGLTPKWLVQRRRLHEAAERLRAPVVGSGSAAGRPDLARVAADLGYADQAHFARDWRAVTGLTPGEFAAEPRR